MDRFGHLVIAGWVPLHILDYYSTIIGLGIGLTETNGLLMFLIDRFGIHFALIFGTILITWGIVYSIERNDWRIDYSLIVLMIIKGAVVINNFYLIFSNS